MTYDLHKELLLATRPFDQLLNGKTDGWLSVIIPCTLSLSLQKVPSLRQYLEPEDSGDSLQPIAEEGKYLTIVLLENLINSEDFR